MRVITPSFSEFERLARKGNLIPLSCEILADQDTPVSAYLKLQKGEHGFLLESVEGGERWARYSFLGTGISSAFRSKGRLVEIFGNHQKLFRANVTDPFEKFRDHMRRYRPAPVSGLPRFYGGAVGYVGYDTTRFFEKLPERARESLGVWDIYLVFCESLLIFDNVRHTIRIVSCCHLPDFATRKEAYEATIQKIEATIRVLRRRGKLDDDGGSPEEPAVLRVRSNMSREHYLDAVRKAKRHVKAGDIIQVVLAQRLKVEEALDPFCL